MQFEIRAARVAQKPGTAIEGRGRLSPPGLSSLSGTGRMQVSFSAPQFRVQCQHLLPGDPGHLRYAMACWSGSTRGRNETFAARCVEDPGRWRSLRLRSGSIRRSTGRGTFARSEEHTSELQSQSNLVCRLLLE